MAKIGYLGAIVSRLQATIGQTSFISEEPEMDSICARFPEFDGEAAARELALLRKELEDSIRADEDAQRVTHETMSLEFRI